MRRAPIACANDSRQPCAEYRTSRLWMPLNTPHKTVKSPVISMAVVQPHPAREEFHPMSSPAKPKPATAPMVFTANRLRDGRVVWLAEAGAWAESVADARVFPPTEAAAGQALAQAGE